MDDTVSAIRETLGAGDQHSVKFHRLVASRIPEKTIRAHLADIRADGARNPGALFTYRMTKYAEDTLASPTPDIRSAIDRLTAGKRVL